MNPRYDLQGVFVGALIVAVIIGLSVAVGISIDLLFAFAMLLFVVYMASPLKEESTK
jgi:hypothetical protein